MKKVSLLVIGPVKTSWIAEGCMQYINRLKHDVKLEIIEIPAGKQKDPDRQRSEECDRLLKHMEKAEGEVWVLDETGKELTSEKFAGVLGALSAEGVAATFVIGGAYGLDDRVRSTADHVLSLSAMTFPHELCRLVFLEQLYRAVQIQKSTGRRASRYGRQAGYHH